jgi:hypothetical protein
VLLFSRPASTACNRGGVRLRERGSSGHLCDRSLATSILVLLTALLPFTSCTQRFGGPLCVTYGFGEVNHPSHVFTPLQDFVRTSDKWMKSALRQSLTTIKVPICSVS